MGRAAMMMTARTILLLMAPSSLLALKMDLYYESPCPDSTRFISNQVPKMWAALSQEVSINFVPYGFASTIEDEDGELHFECQHGERECAGNIVQVEIIRNTIDTIVNSHQNTVNTFVNNHRNDYYNSHHL